MSDKSTNPKEEKLEATAKVRMLKTSPQKLNLVSRMIRNKPVNIALSQLKFSKKRIALDVRKCLESAVANAENNHDLDIEELVVSEAFVGKKKIEQYGQIYEVDHFKLKSKDMSLPKDKRLDFDIWFDKKSSMIVRVSYSRMGNWEYRLKSFE